MTSRAATDDALVNRDRSHNFLTVLIGTNDFGGGSQPDAALFVSRLKTYCQARQASGWQVVVLSILPGASGPFNTFRNSANTLIAADSSFYSAFVNFNGQVWFSDAAGSNVTYFPDGIHPTKAVEDAMAPLVDTVLATIPAH